MSPSTEATSRNVKMDRYGDVAWKGHIWNFHAASRTSSKDNLTEYRVVGTGGRWAEAETGLAVRHEQDGTWTARVDGEVVETCRTKGEAQSAITHGWLGI